VIVSISSSDPSVVGVPATVIVPAGLSTTTFSVETSVVKSSVTTSLTATLKGVSENASLIVLQATLQAVTVVPNIVLGGSTPTGTVTLTGAASNTGIVIKLSSSTPKATVPGSVTVKAGESSVTFAVKTLAVATPLSATITAKSGSISDVASLTINPPSLTSVTVSPSTVVGLTSATGTVTLSSAAPPGGIVIRLSSNQSAATVPVSVTIGSGSTHTTFAIKTGSVPVPTTAVISGELNGQTGAADLTINPPVVTALSLSPSSVIGGNKSTGTVSLSTAAPPGGVTVNLSSNSQIAMIPGSVVVAAGKKTAEFTVTTIKVESQTAVTITAGLNPTSKSTALTIKR